jgi:hypothetical protein
MVNGVTINGFFIYDSNQNLRSNFRLGESMELFVNFNVELDLGANLPLPYSFDISFIDWNDNSIAHGTDVELLSNGQYNYGCNIDTSQFHHGLYKVQIVIWMPGFLDSIMDKTDEVFVGFF